MPRSATSRFRPRRVSFVLRVFGDHADGSREDGRRRVLDGRRIERGRLFRVCVPVDGGVLLDADVVGVAREDAAVHHRVLVDVERLSALQLDEPCLVRAGAVVERLRVGLRDLVRLQKLKHTRRLHFPLNPSTRAWKRSLSLFGTGLPVASSITVSTFHQSASRKEW